MTYKLPTSSACICVGKTLLKDNKLKVLTDSLI